MTLSRKGPSLDVESSCGSQKTQHSLNCSNSVSESALAASLVGLVEKEHVIAEGAGAAATAAIVGRQADARGRRVAIMVTGANIDRARLLTVLA